MKIHFATTTPHFSPKFRQFYQGAIPTQIHQINPDLGRFEGILALAREIQDNHWLYFADALISQPFQPDWFLGASVGLPGQGEFETRKQSLCYVPDGKTYFTLNLFGGLRNAMMALCEDVISRQKVDKLYKCESQEGKYFNHYWHYHPPEKIITNCQWQVVR